MTPWVAQHRRCSSWRLWDHTYCCTYYIFAHFPTVSVMICAINCGLIILIQLICCFYTFHYFSLFSLFLSLSSLFSFCCKSGRYLFMTLLSCSEMCFHSSTSFNIFVLCCFIPLGSSDCLVCDTAFGMQHTQFLGGMCNLVIFG